MPRKPLIRTDQYPYHVYGRSNNKETFYLPLKEVWAITCQLFDKVSVDYDAQVHAFVLMPNHYHLLISTPLCNLDSIMNYWARELSKKINASAHRINRVFGGRYKWCSIQNDVYYANVYKYIYRNPMKANLSKNIETYPWSTYKFIQNTNNPYDLHDKSYCERGIHIPRDFKKREAWLNQSYKEVESELIRRALKRSVFHYSQKNIFSSAIKKFPK